MNISKSLLENKSQILPNTKIGEDDIEAWIQNPKNMLNMDIVTGAIVSKIIGVTLDDIIANLIHE